MAESYFGIDLASMRHRVVENLILGSFEVHSILFLISAIWYLRALLRIILWSGKEQAMFPSQAGVTKSVFFFFDLPFSF
jgi:hypothetical protein